MGDAPETFTQALAEHGVEPLPDVELDFPPWLQDLRAHWSRPAAPTPDSSPDREDPGQDLAPGSSSTRWPR